MSILKFVDSSRGSFSLSAYVYTYISTSQHAVYVAKCLVVFCSHISSVSFCFLTNIYSILVKQQNDTDVI